MKKDVKHYMIAVPKGGLNSLNWMQRAFTVQGMVYSVCCIPCETMLCDVELFEDIGVMFFWSTEECVETLKKHLIEGKFCSCWISVMPE